MNSSQTNEALQRLSEHRQRLLWLDEESLEIKRRIDSTTRGSEHRPVRKMPKNVELYVPLTDRERKQRTEQLEVLVDYFIGLEQAEPGKHRPPEILYFSLRLRRKVFVFVHGVSRHAEIVLLSNDFGAGK
jgi:hypothetical protein